MSTKRKNKIFSKKNKSSSFIKLLSPKEGFTLVELIVVITILAILWTIAFISLQWYSSDARNSKRTSDLNSISSAMSIEITKWIGLLGFVRSDTNAQVENIQIAGSTGSTGWDYDAGRVNYTALWIKEEDFKDSNGSEYAIGVTTRIQWKYQLWAKMEQWGWASVAKLVWTYSPRNPASSVTVISTWALNIVNINDSDIGKLLPGDTISWLGVAVWTTVQKISADEKILTLSNNVTSLGTLSLASAETRGLIDAAWTGTWVVVTDWGDYFPY